MTGFLTQLITYAVKKSIRKEADVTSRGVSGGIGAAICALPLIVACLFIIFGYFAVQDPDPDDRQAGWIALALGGVLILVFLHYVSYRVTITDDLIHTASLFTPEKVIHFDSLFALRYLEEDRLEIRQRSKRIVIGWTIHGYEHMSSLLIEKQQLWQRSASEY